MQNITFSENIAADIEHWLLKQTDISKIFVLVDENTKKHCLPILQNLFSCKKINAPIIIRIKSGEQQKNISTVQKIWKALLIAEADRNSLVLNLGGGVIGDMGGFAAATYKRGIRFVQIPTTLLAMIDASVGGKLGIDFGEIKNSIGVFCAPEQIFITPEFLKTLPPRTLKSGIAEMIKHEAITHENPKFEIQNPPNIEAIRQSVQIKYNIVAQDPFEKNVRKYLNFGHTVGHAIESFFLATDTPLLHGEAVAIGMWTEAKAAVEQGFLDKNSFFILEKALKMYFNEIFTPHFLSVLENPALLKIMQNDKKNELDKIKYIVLQGFGKPKIADFCSSDANK